MAVSVMPYAGCVRVSDTRGRQGKANFYSPEEQRQGILEAAAREGVEVVLMEPDLDFSGGSFERPGFQQALAGVKAGELAGIIVFRWDRFGRNLRESLAMIEEIEAAGGRVISATEPVAEGSGGVLTRDMMLAVANFYRLRIQEGWIATHDRLHERGVTNGRLPTGYIRGEDGVLVLNEFAGDVRWAFEARAGGLSYSAIARELEFRGVQNGAGSSRWYPHCVARLLENRVYLGEVRRGERPVVTGAHPAIVDRELFEAAQRPRAKARPNTRGRYLLAGLVRCAGCLHPMAGSGGQRPMYRCRGVGQTPCPAPSSISVARIEGYVVEQLWRQREELQLRPVRASADLAELELAHLTAERTYRSWLQEHEVREQDRGLWEEERQRLRALMLEAETTYREAQAAQMPDGLPLDPISLRTVWDEADTATRRDLFLRHEIDVVFVRPGGKGKPDLTDRVKILGRGEGPQYRGRVTGPTAPYRW